MINEIRCFLFGHDLEYSYRELSNNHLITYFVCNRCGKDNLR